MEKPKKIGFLETWNRESGMIEKSNGRRNQLMALSVGLIISLLSVTPFVEVTLGESLPIILTLLSYSLGSSIYQKTIELNAETKTKRMLMAAPERVGCTDPLAMNYDPVATKDDGTCIYLAPDNIKKNG